MIFSDKILSEENVKSLLYDYRAMLSCKVEQKKALDRLKEHYYHIFADSGFEEEYYLALAAFELSHGILYEDTKNHALKYCDDNSKNTVLKAQIYKEIMLPSVTEPTDFMPDSVTEYGITNLKKGDVFSYRNGEDDYYLFRVVDIDDFFICSLMPELGKASFAVAMTYIWHGLSAPSMDAVQGLEFVYGELTQIGKDCVKYVERYPYIMYFGGEMNDSDRITVIGNDENYPEMKPEYIDQHFIDMAYEEFLPDYFNRFVKIS